MLVHAVGLGRQVPGDLAEQALVRHRVGHDRPGVGEDVEHDGVEAGAEHGAVLLGGHDRHELLAVGHGVAVLRVQREPPGGGARLERQDCHHLHGALLERDVDRAPVGGEVLQPLGLVAQVAGGLPDGRDLEVGHGEGAVGAVRQASHDGVPPAADQAAGALLVHPHGDAVRAPAGAGPVLVVHEPLHAHAVGGAGRTATIRVDGRLELHDREDLRARVLLALLRRAVVLDGGVGVAVAAGPDLEALGGRIDDVRGNHGLVHDVPHWKDVMSRSPALGHSDILPLLGELCIIHYI